MPAPTTSQISYSAPVPATSSLGPAAPAPSKPNSGTAALPATNHEASFSGSGGAKGNHLTNTLFKRAFLTVLTATHVPTAIKMPLTNLSAHRKPPDVRIPSVPAVPKNPDEDFYRVDGESEGDLYNEVIDSQRKLL